MDRCICFIIRQNNRDLKKWGEEEEDGNCLMNSSQGTITLMCSRRIPVINEHRDPSSEISCRPRFSSSKCRKAREPGTGKFDGARFLLLGTLSSKNLLKAELSNFRDKAGAKVKSVSDQARDMYSLFGIRMKS